jgi:hypothetical protein
MRQTIRLFLLFQAASFVIAGLIHRGMLIGNYQHPQAATAESTIAVVLLVAFA